MKTRQSIGATRLDVERWTRLEEPFPILHSSPTLVPDLAAMSNSGVVQYDNIFHNLEQNAGRLRFTKGGLGWKPTADSSGAAGSSSQTHTLEAERFRSFQWYKAARGYQLRINIDSESETEPPRDCFDGFKKEDYERVADMVRDLYDATLEAVETSTRGWNWGKAEIEDSDVRFYVKDK